MSPLLLTPALATVDGDGWTGGDWVLGVVVPLVLLAAGVVLYLRGKRAYEDATRVRGGFGGPPGSSDVGTERGFGVEDNRAAVLGARRLRLWGLVLAALGLVWLLITLVVALL